MGPINTKFPIGRGDMYEATENVFQELVSQNQMAEFKARWDKLDDEDKKELSELFGGDEDMDELVKDSFTVENFIRNLEHNQKKELF